MLLATAAAAAVLAAADGVPSPEDPRINVGGVVNAASSLPAPDNYVSPGAIISIYGTGLSNVTQAVTVADLVGGALPKTLSGVQVSVGGLNAPLFFVSPLQINAQMPGETQLQPGMWPLTVRLVDLESSVQVEVRAYSPGLFSVARHADGTLVSRDAPGRPGEFLLFFGTGFGPTVPSFFAGQLAPPGPTWMVSFVQAAIGGIPLPPGGIYYSGLCPSFAGLYQFNLQIPPAAPSGDLEVRVQVAGKWSQPGVRIPVAP
ncbi:MAG TPA: hypothetical protein VEU62_19810 [Bryobacterales bacterium]|nr:hypothetical protein [Bryobacterales bacterium]